MIVIPLILRIKGERAIQRNRKTLTMTSSQKRISRMTFTIRRIFGFWFADMNFSP
jgi:hypothetical protein